LKGFSFSAVEPFNVTLAVIIDCSWNAVFISLLFLTELNVSVFCFAANDGCNSGQGTGKDVEGGHSIAVLS